jgi:acyl dehydratase
VSTAKVSTAKVSTTTVRDAAQDWPKPFVRGLYWTDMTVGSAYSTASRMVTETDLMRFVSMGFTEPLFTDPAGAQEAGYHGRLVPGALTFALAEGLLMQTNVIHGTGIAFLGTTMTVSAPVFVGDTIGVAWTVTEARPTSKGNRGIVTTRNLVRRQDGQIVMEYSPTRMIAGPPPSGPASGGSRS